MFKLLYIIFAIIEELLVYEPIDELKVLKEGFPDKMDVGFTVDILQSICQEASMDKQIWNKMVFQIHRQMKSIKIKGY